MRIVKFYRISFLRNTAAQLLLISCNIFNEPIALSVINQFIHSYNSVQKILEKLPKLKKICNQKRNINGLYCEKLHLIVSSSCQL